MAECYSVSRSGSNPDRLLSQQELDANVEAFRLLADAAPYGILLVGRGGVISVANDRLHRIFGYEKGELVGEKLEKLLPQRIRADHVGYRDGFMASPSQRTMGTGRDLTGLRKDGVEFPVEIGLSYVDHPEGRLSFATVIDITDRKRAELKLRDANAQLEEFSYVASHDLRSPLRGIASLIEFVRDDFGSTAPASAINNLDRMAGRVAKMEKLIENLLAYARAGQRSPRSEKVDIGQIVDNILVMMPPPNGFEVLLDMRAPVFDGARVPLETAIRNLYANALKHHDREAGTVRITSAAEGNFCVVDVVDDGPGIPEQSQQRAFRLFQTLSEGGGTGLGLAVTQRLVECHGGKIELISIDGQRGSRFRVWWPLFARSDLDD